MISTNKTRRLLASALLALGLTAGLHAAESASSAAKGSAKSEVTKAKEQAEATRNEKIKEYEALAKQLRDATEEQRKVILEKMQERKKAFEEAQNALHQQIRDEQRQQRRDSAPKR